MEAGAAIATAITAALLVPDGNDARGVHALGPFDDVERHGLTCLQGLVALHLDGGIMSEEIIPPIVRQNESKPLGVVEPFHLPGTHILVTPTSYARVAPCLVHFLYTRVRKRITPFFYVVN